MLSGNQKWATFSRDNEVYSLCGDFPFPTEEIQRVASLQMQMSGWCDHHIRIPDREI